MLAVSHGYYRGVPYGFIRIPYGPYACLVTVPIWAAGDHAGSQMPRVASCHGRVGTNNR